MIASEYVCVVRLFLRGAAFVFTTNIHQIDPILFDFILIVFKFLIDLF